VIFEAIILGVIVAFFRGGKIQRLAELPLKYPWAIVAALLLRIGAVDLASRGVVFFVNYGAWMQMLAFIMLAAALWFNYPALRIAAAGATLNLLVIAANSGVMPISVKALSVAGLDMQPAVSHAFIGSTTSLWFLGDIIPLPPPYPFNKVVSIGDLVLLVGVVVYISWVMRDRKAAD